MAKGRAVAIVLDDVEKTRIDGVDAQAWRAAGGGGAGAHRSGCGGRSQQQGDCGEGRRLCRTRSAHGATALPQSRMDGLYDEPRPGAPREIGDDEIASHDPQDAGDATQGCDALEPAEHGQRDRSCAFDGASHLARLRSAAAPRRDFQAVLRSAVRGEGARHRRALLVAARARHRAVRR